jgi:predicted nucleic acid-binding protein
VIYLDTSAVVKLAHLEAETDALRAWLAANPQPLVSSALVRTEAARALIRAEPAALPALRAVLSIIHQRPVSDAVLDAAAALPDPGLRSPDAIHLATADGLARGLAWFVCYHKRLCHAAEARGLAVVGPHR